MRDTTYHAPRPYWASVGRLLDLCWHDPQQLLSNFGKVSPREEFSLTLGNCIFHSLYLCI